MKKARTKTIKSGRGRKKTTGPGLALVVRMHKPQLEALDSWIGKAEISRPEGVRQLLNWALTQHAR